jgi:hypothetical protein
MTSRYSRYQPQLNYLAATRSSKCRRQAPKVILDRIAVSAGPYKLSGLLTQHFLILSAILAKPALTAQQVHGKRRRRTALLSGVLRRRCA